MQLYSLDNFYLRMSLAELLHWAEITVGYLYEKKDPVTKKAAIQHGQAILQALEKRGGETRVHSKTQARDHVA